MVADEQLVGGQRSNSHGDQDVALAFLHLLLELPDVDVVRRHARYAN